MILNTRAANGALSSAGRTTVWSLWGSIPSMGGMSSGDGRYSTTASSSGCTPLFLKALPQITGCTLLVIVARRRAALSSSLVTASPVRYFSRSWSSVSEIASTICSRILWA